MRDSNRIGETCGVLKKEGKMNCYIYKNGNLLGNLDPSRLTGGDSDGSGKGGRSGKGGKGNGTGDSKYKGKGSGDGDVGCN